VPSKAEIPGQGGEATVAAGRNPEGIVSINPALTDEIGLRWVANHKLKSTLEGLNRTMLRR
jgi:hypothetical protein